MKKSIIRLRRKIRFIIEMNQSKFFSEISDRQDSVARILENSFSTVFDPTSMTLAIEFTVGENNWMLRRIMNSNNGMNKSRTILETSEYQNSEARNKFEDFSIKFYPRFPGFRLRI